MRPAIGLVGGLGPYAGIDIIRRLHDNVRALSDQDYPDVIMVSMPGLVPDRTEYIKHPDTQNPAVGIAFAIKKLALAGATHVAVLCNTAHAPIILNQVKAFIELENLAVELVSLISETYRYAKGNCSGRRIGLLATEGTYFSGVYKNEFENEGRFDLIEPSAEDRQRVQDAIYNRQFGIKAWSAPVKQEAVELLGGVAERLVRNDKIDALIMGCTEIPLAMEHLDLHIPLLNPGTLLCRALLRAVAPDRLNPQLSMF